MTCVLQQNVWPPSLTPFAIINLYLKTKTYFYLCSLAWLKERKKTCLIHSLSILGFQWQFKNLCHSWEYFIVTFIFDLLLFCVDIVSQCVHFCRNKKNFVGIKKRQNKSLSLRLCVIEFCIVCKWHFPKICACVYVFSLNVILENFLVTFAIHEKFRSGVMLYYSLLYSKCQENLFSS